jgi:crossover junction endodeoxyribonuclease RuvC
MQMRAMRILGLDPGLQRTGWGAISVEGSRLHYIGAGVFRSAADRPLAERLAALHAGLLDVMARERPDVVAVEETFVNRNPRAALALGQARGVSLLVPALEGIEVAEYSTREVKKAVTGQGQADKDQVAAMVRRLLPMAEVTAGDAADALAVAICHAHAAASRARWAVFAQAQS